MVYLAGVRHFELGLGGASAAIDEIAVEGELADERIDLGEGERTGDAPFEVAAHEAIRRDAELARGRTRRLDGGHAVPLGKGKHAEDASDADGAVLLMDRRAERADRPARAGRAREDGEDIGRRPPGSIGGRNAMLAARLPAMPLTIRQVDPIIRQLTLYRDLIADKAQENHS